MTGESNTTQKEVLEEEERGCWEGADGQRAISRNSECKFNQKDVLV